MLTAQGAMPRSVDEAREMFDLDTIPTISDQYALCIDAWGGSSLPAQKDITIVWSKIARLTNSQRLVVGETSVYPGRVEIMLCAPYFVALEQLCQRCVDAVWQIVVIHELAHVADALRHPKLTVLTHGRMFASLMRKLHLPTGASIPYDVDESGRLVIPGTPIGMRAFHEDVFRVSHGVVYEQRSSERVEIFSTVNPDNVRE